MSSERLIVGLAGGSASGKTSFIKSLSMHFGSHELAVISQDNYYKPQSQQLVDEYGHVNFDLPSGIDFSRLRKDVRTLLKGQAVEIVEYTFNNSSRFPKTIRVESARIILVEGLFVFSDRPLKRMFDRRLLIDVDPVMAKARRMARDLAERGMQRQEVEYQWNNHVLPAYDQHLLPHVKDVHYVIDNSTDFTEGMKKVKREFEQFLGLEAL